MASEGQERGDGRFTLEFEQQADGSISLVGPIEAPEIPDGVGIHGVGGSIYVGPKLRAGTHKREFVNLKMVGGAELPEVHVSDT